jgi:TetR/AcrR family transcriptional repressor of lmrAB and yxaGH operons
VANSRKQAIETAEQLFRSQGYAATGVAQIIAESGSPKGSFYFNFPGGKHELALEALRLFAQRRNQRIEEATIASAGDPAEYVRFSCARMARDLEASAWTKSCLVQQLASELAPGDEEITLAIAEITRDWIGRIAQVLQRATTSRAQSRTLATAFLAGMSGALTMARVTRSKAPFEALAATMTDLIRHAASGLGSKVARRKAPKTVRASLITH